MEEHTILSERLENQLKAVEWAKAEQKRLLKEKGERKMKIEHIAMYVTDLEATKNFFIKYFGAEANNEYHNLKTDFRSYFLSFDEGARLEIMNKPQMLDKEKDINRTGYIHIAFSLGMR